MAAVRYYGELRNINDFSSQTSEGPRENKLIHSAFKDVIFFMQYVIPLSRPLLSACHAIYEKIETLKNFCPNESSVSFW